MAVDTASELIAFTNWTTDVASMTGLFYDSGRLYFTRSGSPGTLFYRYFTPESDVVGAQRLTASTNVTRHRLLTGARDVRHRRQALLVADIG